MKLAKLTTLFSALIIGACAQVTAQSNDVTDYTLYVYEDCKETQRIIMNDEQIAAYKALKRQEVVMENIESPAKEVEVKLAKLEKKMESLGDDVVFANAKVNVALVKQYEAIAKQMEKVVEEHEQDFRKLEQQARQIESAARRFENAIEPSVKGLRANNVHISVGKANTHYRCHSA